MKIKYFIMLLCLVTSVSLIGEAHASISIEHLNVSEVSSFTKSYGTAFSPDGYFYVSFDPNTILKVNPSDLSDKTIFTINNLEGIDDIAFDSTGKMWVSDYIAKKIHAFEKENDNWNFASPHKTFNTSDIQPQALHFIGNDYSTLYFYGGDRNFYKIDVSQNNSIPILIYGKTGEKYSSAAGIADYNDKLYFTDKESSLIIEYNPEFTNYRTHIDLTDSINNIDSRLPNSIAIDVNGNMWVGCDFHSNTSCTDLLVFDSAKRLIDSTQDIARFHSITVNPSSGIIYLSGLRSLSTAPPIWKATLTQEPLASTTNEIDIDFNKDTKDIFISWDFGDRKSCHVKTEIYLDGVKYYYLGTNKELKLGQIGIINNATTQINCSGKLVNNFSDYSNKPLEKFSLFMSFSANNTSNEILGLAEAALLYSQVSDPVPITCSIGGHCDGFTQFSDYVIGPTKGVKTTFYKDDDPSKSRAIVEYFDGLFPKPQKNGGCSDCTPPTLGLDKNFKRVVDNGFSYNGQTVQVEKWHTEFPLINATIGIPNLVEIKVYENTGITNMKWTQFCIGAEEIGMPLNDCEVLIEVHLLTNGTDTGIAVDEIVINDKDNLIDNDSVSANTYVTECMIGDTIPNCVEVDLQYTYREETFNHMMVVNVVDKARNSQNFYLNEGVNVLGESLNEPPTITLSNKQTSQQKDNLTITYTRVDKITDTWMDENGIEYHRINDVIFDRLTPREPYQCNDPPLEEVQVWKRTNCHFRELTSLWTYN